jgi:hypothetical protein
MPATVPHRAGGFTARDGAAVAASSLSGVVAIMDPKTPIVFAGGPDVSVQARGLFERPLTSEPK